MLDEGALDHVLAPLKKYLSVKNVVELQVTEPGAIWVETTDAGMKRHKDNALTMEFWEQLARLLSNQLRIVDFWRKPYLACTLPGGHRLQLCLGTTVQSGIAASFRIWRPRMFGLDSYNLTPDTLALLRHAIQHKWNIIISGGMFSGKTSLTNALISIIPAGDRVLSVQDAPELDLSHILNKSEFIVNRLATAEEIDFVEVLKAITRLRPDRVIVGELNIDNTWIMARILNLGHGGAISTVHADSPDLAFEAMLVNVEANGKPITAAEKIFRNRVDVILQIDRLPDYRRAVTDVWVNPIRKQAAAQLAAAAE